MNYCIRQLNADDVRYIREVFDLLKPGSGMHWMPCWRVFAYCCCAKKVIGYHQSYYLNTLRYIQKLSRVNGNDKAAIAVFRAEVEGNKAVIEKDWPLGVAK